MEKIDLTYQIVYVYVYEFGHQFIYCQIDSLVTLQISLVYVCAVNMFQTTSYYICLPITIFEYKNTAKKQKKISFKFQQ